MIARLKALLLHNTSARQTVFKNTFWLFTGELIGRLVRFFIVVYAARVLGAAEYGVFSYALTVAAFLTIFSDIGISALLTRETVKNPELRQRYFSAGFALKVILIAICALAVIFILPLVSNVPGIQSLLIFIVLIFAFDSLREFGFGMNRALERMEREAFVKIIMNFAIAGLGFLFLWRVNSAYSISFGYMLGTAIGLLLMTLLLREYVVKIFQSVEWKLVWPLFKAAWPIGLLSVLGAIMINTDMIMLGWWRTPEELGYYATAQKIILLLYVIPTLIASALFPTFSRLAKVNNVRFRAILEKGLSTAQLLAFPLVAGGLALAQPLITLFFGNEYIPATLTFSLLLATILIVFPSTLLANALFAFNEQRQFITFAALGALSNALLNALLIPAYGIEGAAVATLGSQLVANTFVWFKMKQTNPFSVLSHLVRIVPAAVAMGLLALFLNQLELPVLVTITISGLSYFGLLWLLKEPVLNEARLVLGLMRKS